MKRVFAYILLTIGILTAAPENALEKKPRIATTQELTREWIQVIAGETVTTELLVVNDPPSLPLSLVIETGLERKGSKLSSNTPRVVLSDGLLLLKEGQTLRPKVCKRSKKAETTACCCDTKTPSPRYEAVFDPALMQAQTHPYAWMDVSLATSMIVSLTETLCDLAPEHALLYKKRSAVYQEKLKALDLEIFASIDALPPSALKEPNPSWRYFTRRYGLNPGKTGTLPELPVRGKTYIETIQLQVNSLKNKGFETFASNPQNLND